MLSSQFLQLLWCWQVYGCVWTTTGVASWWLVRRAFCCHVSLSLVQSWQQTAVDDTNIVQLLHLKVYKPSVQGVGMVLMKVWWTFGASSGGLTGLDKLAFSRCFPKALKYLQWYELLESVVIIMQMHYRWWCSWSWWHQDGFVVDP